MLTEEQLREERTKAALRAEHFNEVFFRFFRLPKLGEILLVFLIVFWMLPEAGHQILLSNNYYGLKDAPIFLNGEPDCADFDEKISLNINEVRGKFLAVYPYRAYAIEMCDFNEAKERVVDSYRIYARAPHTFLTNWMETLSENPVHKNIYYKKP